MKKSLSLFLSFIMLLSALSLFGLTAFADDTDIEKGKCGANAYYTFNTETQILVIEGKGTIYKPESNWGMEDFQAHTVIIKDGITNIPENAFLGDEDIKRVEIADTVQSIGAFAFSWCRDLKEVKLPKNLKTIESNAFSNCNAVKSIVIPAGVSKIKPQAFTVNNPALTISVENGNRVYDSRNNCNAIIETKTNTLVLGCAKTVLPKNLKAVGAYAFSECYGLKSINIPDSVKTIGKGAFYRCINIKSIKLPKKLKVIKAETLSECCELKSIKFPKTLKSIGDSSLNGTGLKVIKIPEGVKSIGSGAFYMCTDVKKVYLPSTLKKVGMAAFDGELRENRTYNVYYNGKRKQWNKVKDEGDNLLFDLGSIKCKDGTFKPIGFAYFDDYNDTRKQFKGVAHITSGADGAQVKYEYYTAKGKKTKTVILKGKSKNVNIKKARKTKAYNIAIRNYRNAGGIKQYGTWHYIIIAG